MTTIAEKVKVYQQAFQLARDHLSKNQYFIDKAGIVRHLHDAIRREISAGLKDPVAIAAGAVRALERDLRS